MLSGQIKVKTSVRETLVNPVEQIYEGSLTLEVDDAGEKKILQATALNRQIYPQEFLLFVAARNDFEFVGWWNNWDLTQPLDGTSEIVRPIIVLRRK